MATKKPGNSARRYSAAEKAVAVQAVLASGGIVTSENLRSVRVLLKSQTISFSTLYEWVKNHTTPDKTAEPPYDSRALPTSKAEKSESLDFAKATTLQIVEHTLRNYARRANEESAVLATEGKDSAKVMGDMVKLYQLLQGYPTEIIGIMDDLTAVAELLSENDVELKPAVREWRERIEMSIAKKNQVVNG